MTNVLNLEQYLFDRQFTSNEDQLPPGAVTMHISLIVHLEVKAAFDMVKKWSTKKNKNRMSFWWPDTKINFPNYLSPCPVFTLGSVWVTAEWVRMLSSLGTAAWGHPNFTTDHQNIWISKQWSSLVVPVSQSMSIPPSVTTSSVLSRSWKKREGTFPSSPFFEEKR